MKTQALLLPILASPSCSGLLTSSTSCIRTSPFTTGRYDFKSDSLSMGQYHEGNFGRAVHQGNNFRQPLFLGMKIDDEDINTVDVRVESKESASGSNINRDDDSGQPPLKFLKELFDAAVSSPFYRTFLLTVPLFTNPFLQRTFPLPVRFIILFIVLAANTYQSRSYEIDVVAPQRWRNLQNLRDVKSRQLSSGASMEDVEAAKTEYEETLRKEMALRIILPGLWVLPLDPGVPDMEASRQLLGLRITEKCELVPIENDDR